MAYYDTATYVSSVSYAAVAQFATLHSYSVGDLVRQLAAPSAGQSRVFVCTVAGTSGGSEPSWLTGIGNATTSGGATFNEASGRPALNGDLTNTPVWASGTAYQLGQIIQRTSAASLQICTTAGTSAGSEPSFSDTAGATTSDNTIIWTSLGPPSNYPSWGAASASLVDLTLQVSPIFVANNHAATHAAATSISLSGDVNTVVKVLSVDVGHTPPTANDLSSGASEATTGSNILSVGWPYSYFYGMTFSSGSGAVSTVLKVPGTNASGGSNAIFEDCILAAPGTSSASGKIGFGIFSTPSGVWYSEITLINTKLQFGNSSDNLGVRLCRLHWKDTNGTYVGASTPTQLFGAASLTFGGQVIMERLNFNAGTYWGGSGPILIKDCTGVFDLTPTNAHDSGQITRLRSNNNQLSDIDYWDSGLGELKFETNILRTGGASDGGTDFSWKLIPNSSFTPPWVRPFKCPPIAAWNSTTGVAVTATLYGLWDAVSVPKDDQLWFELEYLGNSGNSLGTRVSSGKLNYLDIGVSLTSDGSSWADPLSALARFTPFSMQVSFTPQQAGWLYAIICLAGSVSAAPIGAIFVDPAIYLS